MTPQDRAAKLAELRELVIAGMTGARRDPDRIAELMAELYPEGNDDPPVPGGPPMREGNNPRTGIAWNE